MADRLLLLSSAALADRPPRAADLYRRRIAAGLTQADLAALSGIDRALVNAYETGREAASPSQQARIDAALGMAMKKAAGSTAVPTASGEASGDDTDSRT